MCNNFTYPRANYSGPPAIAGFLAAIFCSHYPIITCRLPTLLLCVLPGSEHAREQVHQLSNSRRAPHYLPGEGPPIDPHGDPPQWCKWLFELRSSEMCLPLSLLWLCVIERRYQDMLTTLYSAQPSLLRCQRDNDPGAGRGLRIYNEGEKRHIWNWKIGPRRWRRDRWRQQRDCCYLLLWDWSHVRRGQRWRWWPSSRYRNGANGLVS